MRTTLTLDDDVASLLERARKSRETNFKTIVNEALRQGLREMTKPSLRGKPYQTREANLGRCLVAGLDDISEALAVAEGDTGHRPIATIKPVKPFIRL